MPERSARVPAALIGCTLAAMSLFFVAFDLDWFPLGIPGEWIWGNPDAWAMATAEWMLFLPAGAAALMLIGWTFWSAGWLEAASRGKFMAAIATCIALGSVFQFLCEVACPDGLQKWAMLQSYSANGFHAAARHFADDLPAFLRNHSELIASEHPHHFSVNPPGWILVDAALMNYFAARPQLAEQVTLWLRPDEMGVRLRRMNGTKGVPWHEQATLATLAAGSRLVCFLGAIPAAWLAGARGGRKAALAAASAVLLLPIAPLFAPRCDTVYPTIALTVLALSHAAWERRSWLAAAAAGLVLGIGTFFSMCFFTIGGLAVLFVAALSFRGKQRPATGAMIAAPLAWLAVVGLIYLLAGHNSWATWAVNIAKNTEFNRLYRQSYAAWTVVNLLEFGAALGLPVVIFLAGRVAVLRPFDPLLLAWAGLIALLDLAGTNRGEACRLWLFLMPIGAMLAVDWLPQLGRWFRPTLAAFLAMQALNCVMLDRDLLLLTDLEPSRAFLESGLSELKANEQGLENQGKPAAALGHPGE